MLIGGTYLNRKDFNKVATELAGLSDLTYKAREGKVLAWLWQSEVFYQKQKPEGAQGTEKIGGYVFGQYGLDENWSVGLRADGFTEPRLRDPASDESIGNLTYALVPQITYSTSEFSRFRLAYAHEVRTAEHAPETRERILQLQYTFFMGAHPTHDF